jgi:hypothetical protein
MKRKQNKRLWRVINGEPWLLGGADEEVDIRGKELWFAKDLLEDSRTGRFRVFLVNPPALSFHALPKEGLVLVDDVARFRKCTQQTVYRAVERGLLQPHPKTIDHGPYMFKQEDVIRWASSTVMRRGRPKKLVNQIEKGGEKYANKERTSRRK